MHLNWTAAHLKWTRLALLVTLALYRGHMQAGRVQHAVDALPNVHVISATTRVGLLFSRARADIHRHLSNAVVIVQKVVQYYRESSATLLCSASFLHAKTVQAQAGPISLRHASQTLNGGYPSGSKTEEFKAVGCVRLCTLAC